MNIKLELATLSNAIKMSLQELKRIQKGTFEHIKTYFGCVRADYSTHLLYGRSAISSGKGNIETVIISVEVDEIMGIN